MHEQVQVQIVDHDEPIVACLVEKFQPSRIALIVNWSRLDIGEGWFLLVVRVGVVIVA